MTPGRRRWTLPAFYALATVQLTWCYLWLTRPYVNTLLYEQGAERMPFQGRALMMLPLRLAHSSATLRLLGHFFALSHFWFPRPVQPEVLVQALIDTACLALTGLLTTRLYQHSSRRRLLTPFVYPLVLIVFAATYILHTVQNFRFLYDLPSLAFFTAAFYLLYTRKRRPHFNLQFAALFILATLNRETTLLLLPLYLLDHALDPAFDPALDPAFDPAFNRAFDPALNHSLDSSNPTAGRLHPRHLLARRLHICRLLAPRSLAAVTPLALFWLAWELFLHHHFAHNRSEFYPRLNWNIKSLLLPAAWPQLLSACGYLLPFVLLRRRHLPDPRLRAWLWIVPLWLLFMFSYGILIETRVFGELIPLVVCASTLLIEEQLATRLQPQSQRTPTHPLRKAA